MGQTWSGVLQNSYSWKFENIHRKTPVPKPFLIQKRDYSTDIFLWTLRCILKYHFYRTPSGDCFCFVPVVAHFQDNWCSGNKFKWNYFNITPRLDYVNVTLRLRSILYFRLMFNGLEMKILLHFRVSLLLIVFFIAHQRVIEWWKEIIETLLGKYYCRVTAYAEAYAEPCQTANIKLRYYLPHL